MDSLYKLIVNFEVAACAKAYVNATNNPIRGTDQTQAEFIADILRKLKHFAPSNLDARAGTYHNRGTVVWSHLRDSVFGDMQKFIFHTFRQSSNSQCQ